MIHCFLTPNGPLMLPPGRSFVIGRGIDCDIRIEGKSISRKHARLEWKAGAFVLVDLGSANGTTVNGKRIQEQPLVDQDRIGFGFGDDEIVYRMVDGTEALRGSAKEIMDKATRGLTERYEAMSLSPSATLSDLRGRLETLHLVEVCQMLRLSQRTGRLSLRNDAGAKGVLVFQDGEILWAECGKNKGEAAVRALFAFSSGTFRFIEEAVPGQRNVERDTQTLLLDAARLHDEEAPPGGL